MRVKHNAVGARTVFQTTEINAVQAAAEANYEEPRVSCHHYASHICILHHSMFSKYFSRTCLLIICTAKFPASIIAHPLFASFFVLGGIGIPGWALSRLLRTTRTTDSIDPRFSVPSFTYLRHDYPIPNPTRNFQHALSGVCFTSYSPPAFWLTLRQKGAGWYL